MVSGESVLFNLKVRVSLTTADFISKLVFAKIVYKNLFKTYNATKDIIKFQVTSNTQVTSKRQEHLQIVHNVEWFMNTLLYTILNSSYSTSLGLEKTKE